MVRRNIKGSKKLLLKEKETVDDSWNTIKKLMKLEERDCGMPKKKGKGTVIIQKLPQA